MNKSNKTTLALGKSLIKNRRKQKIKDQLSQRHINTDDVSIAKSVTENTSLEEFLSTAEMSNKQFIAERNALKLVQVAPTTTTNAILPNYLDEDLESELLIPRRPKWDKNTTSEELKQLENESYLKWRRKLATLQERDDIILTPFEKNLDFWRQLWRVVEKSDVLVQILDARNPMLFFCEDLEHYIKEIDEKKMNIILLNKADFLTEEQRKHWLNYFSSVGKVCVFFSALEQQELTSSAFEHTQNFHEQLEKLKIDNGLHMPLSYSELILYFKSLRNELGMSDSTSITIGLVGYPNVGKSSTINSLLRTKKVSVSAMPGKTKHFQTIILDDEITICDCPGLVFPNIVSSKAEMIINGILPIDQMKNAVIPIGLIAAKIPAHIFELLYGIMLPKPEDECDDADLEKYVSALELLSAYGYSRGFMSQRGLPDTSRAARYLLKDFVTGKLLYCYAPPNMKQADFHIFPKNNIPIKKITDRKLIRVYEGNNLTEKNFDVEYFRSRNSTVHTKGSHGISNYSRDFADKGDAAAINREGKPWKKHNNRNKKEKLRRVFSYLDE